LNIVLVEKRYEFGLEIVFPVMVGLAVYVIDGPFHFADAYRERSVALPAIGTN
jgi:hypothetical protein